MPSSSEQNNPNKKTKTSFKFMLKIIKWMVSLMSYVISPKDLGPISTKDASKNYVWKSAMEEELRATEKNGSWVLVPL